VKKEEVRICEGCNHEVKTIPIHDYEDYLDFCENCEILVEGQTKTVSLAEFLEMHGDA